MTKDEYRAAGDEIRTLFASHAAQIEALTETLAVIRAACQPILAIADAFGRLPDETDVSDVCEVPASIFRAVHAALARIDATQG